MHFGFLNFEKQHKEGTCKVLGRSVVFSAFYADFCFCSKLVIITTLSHEVFPMIEIIKYQTTLLSLIIHTIMSPFLDSKDSNQ